MPLPSRLLAAVTALVATTGCEAELYRGLDETQADEIVLALDAAGIGAERAREDGADQSGYRVIVARDDVAAALGVLRDQDLPSERAPGFEELFGDPGLVPSAAEERARLSSAVRGELARSLESMTGVTRARVHVALPYPSGRLLDAEAARARASVLIEHRPGARVDEAAVRALVAGAVQELAPDDVAVVRSEATAPPSRAPQLSRVGPFAVSRGSDDALTAVLAATFALNLILALALILSRRRRTNDTVTRGEPGPAMEG